MLAWGEKRCQMRPVDTPVAPSSALPNPGFTCSQGWPCRPSRLFGLRPPDARLFPPSKAGGLRRTQPCAAGVADQPPPSETFLDPPFICPLRVHVWIMANNKLVKNVLSARRDERIVGSLPRAFGRPLTFEPAARQIHQNRQLPSKSIVNKALFFRNGIPFATLQAYPQAVSRRRTTSLKQRTARFWGKCRYSQCNRLETLRENSSVDEIHSPWLSLLNCLRTNDGYRRKRTRIRKRAAEQCRSRAVRAGLGAAR